MTTKKHIIVVGAGLGGLAVAARLAYLGHAVTVFEKQSQAGGRCGVIRQNSFQFDTGPTLYLMPEVFEETFSDLGRRREDYYALHKVDPNYRIHFHDGDSLMLQTDLVAMEREIERVEPGAFPRYLQFLAQGGYKYRTSLERFLQRNFHHTLEFFSPRHLPLMWQLEVGTTHYAKTARYFNSDKLRRALTFQTMYLGTSPFESLATYTLLQYTELANGIYLPKRGMYSVIEAFVHLLDELGVTLVCDAPVAAITLQGRRATGVRLEDGTSVQADAVVANADLPYVYEKLLPHPDARLEAERLQRRRYTSSAVMFYWGLGRSYQQELPIHHNVFLAADYRGSFEQIFQHYRSPEDPSFYIACPGRTDPSPAGEGKEAWVVLVPVGHLQLDSEVDWDAQARHVKAQVLARLAAVGVNDVEQHLEFEAVATPQYFAETLNLTKGAAFGLAHNFSQVGYMRPHNKADRFKGLYFVGASTHPGTGLPIVLISAKLAAERVIKDL